MTQYYSKTKQNYVNINDMHHQHVWYAFKKLCDRLEELGICEHIWEDDYKPTNLKKVKKLISAEIMEQPDFKKLVGGYVRRDVYELLFNKCERLENENNKLKKEVKSGQDAKSLLAVMRSPKSQINQIFKLEREVSRLKGELKRLTKTNKDMYHSYFNPHLKNKGHRYVFSNIPNDNNGKSLVKTMRFYLNKDTYNMRVRGQYLDKSKLERGESWKTYDDGQPLSKSKCIRVYLDKKKESA